MGKYDTSNLRYLLTQMGSMISTILVALDQPQEPDRWLSVAETADMLGRDKRWIYRRSKHLPFVVREGRMISCSLHGVQKYMRARTNNP